MIYITNKPKSRRILGMLDKASGETEDNILGDRVRVDTWKAVTRRHPGQPWRHMSSLYGTCDGETLIVAGAGPSVKGCPESPPGHVSFAVNRAIRHVKATYWLAHDVDAYLSNKDHPNAKKAIGVFSIQLYPLLMGQNCVMIEADSMPRRWKNMEERPLYWNETTLGWALHLGVRMGFDRIVTIGTELSDDGMYDGHVQEGRDLAWQKGQHAGCRERMLEMFAHTEEWMDCLGCEILDASGGALPVPKVRLDEIAG